MGCSERVECSERLWPCIKSSFKNSHRGDASTSTLTHALEKARSTQVANFNGEVFECPTYCTILDRLNMQQQRWFSIPRPQDALPGL
ncbi:hypothetical protein QJS04_geneDACA017798 [Acorus gramineus]|uniref:Uncharacterized protein n=1 Tax=Acorus gramineus TaxID=55184 RepID=A0AAV9BMG0_ACOGR|nr:hypothetical protein QJS04_geneDACA017798 [Acorus gramineus]